MIGLSRSTFYAHSEQKALAREGKDADLFSKIEEIHLEMPFYGYRRVQAELARRGHRVNHKKLKRVMQKHNIRAVQFRSFVHTTDSNHCYRIFPNRAAGFVPTSPNRLWATDITYIRISTCFVYLSVILDVYSRKAVGWSISKNIDTNLCLASLQMAIDERHPPEGCIHHSDRGVQYASHQYIETLIANGFEISMSRKGNPYDNAFAESFWKSLKYEEVHLWNYETYEEVLERVPFFIEEVYNKKRLHSSLGYMPPAEFEMKKMSL